MDRREMLGLLGAGAVTFTAVNAQADEKSADECCQLDKTHEDCLKACADCAKSCDMAFHHALTELTGGKKDAAKTIQLLSDCAGFCGLSACMISRMSPLMVNSCAACAESCRMTRMEVEKCDSDVMKAVAKKLSACEQSCRTMVASMRAGSSLKAN